MQPEFCVVLVTVPDRKTAEKIARTVVEERLAACVTILPGATSVYRWEGKIETADELQLFIKTREIKFAPLEQRILDLHPYEVPEILSLPLQHGDSDYIDWVRKETE